MPDEHSYSEVVVTDQSWMNQKGLPALSPNLWPYLPTQDRRTIIAAVTLGRFPDQATMASIARKAEYVREVGEPTATALFTAQVRLASEIYAVGLTMDHEQHPPSHENIRLRHMGMVEALCCILESGHHGLVLPEVAGKFVRTEGASYYQACVVTRIMQD